MNNFSVLYKCFPLEEEEIQKMNQVNYLSIKREHTFVWHNNNCMLSQANSNLIFNETKTSIMVCDGVIYNFLELKTLLVDKGHVFNSDSSVEVIIHLYEEYGDECVKWLDGMFAFCIYDINKGQLIMARDRVGEKLLYYSQLPTGFVVSTELQSILKNFIVAPQIDMERFLEPIRFTGPLDLKNTYIDQIKRVLPGQIIKVNSREVSVSRYWEWKKTYDYTEHTDDKTETLKLLNNAVLKCYNSNQNVAIMLSGGVDSSAIAALASSNGNEIHTITTGYAGCFDCDERIVARRFAKEQGFIHHEIELNIDDYESAFEELTQHIDEPITDAAQIAQWAMFKKVKALGFDVLLCGMGGDELFYGYPAWNNLSDSWYLYKEHQSMFPWNSKEKKLAFVNFLIKHWKKILFCYYPNKIEDRSFSWWLYDDFVKAIDGASFSFGGITVPLNANMVYKDFKKCSHGDELDTIYNHAINVVMVGAYLYLSNKLGTANGIEVRSPFLDYKLIEHVMSLPQSVKYMQGKPKQYLKDVLIGIVPNYILYAKKRGFTPPENYVNEIAKKHTYQYIFPNVGFYNTALADQVLINLFE